MSDIKVSLFASAVRPKIWTYFLDSLKDESVDVEVVFGGHCRPEEVGQFLKKYENLKYIHTARIKPAQVYEVTRRACKGEVVVWVADDAEFVGGVLSKAYEYWRAMKNEKLILSLQTKESAYGNREGTFFDMKDHAFFGFDKSTPLMAPLAMMSRKYLDSLGGIDRRYVCGQYENDIVMRVYADGGDVEIFGDRQSYIWIDHLQKSIACGESKNESDFLKRPFAKGYGVDRSILEKSWAVGRRVLNKQIDEFQPFSDENILTESQSNKGIWI